MALLAAPTGDLALAEDALATAFEQALMKWPGTVFPAIRKGGCSQWPATTSATPGSLPFGAHQCLLELPAVLEAIYGCYAMAASGTGEANADLSGEAQYLALTLAGLLGSEPEPWGLAAPITLSLARASEQGDHFVPLDEQDTALWDVRLIAEGERYLRRATAVGAPGRFQLVAPSLGARVGLAAVVGRVESPEAG